MMSTHTGKDTEEETKGAGVSSLLFSETQNIPDSVILSKQTACLPIPTRTLLSVGLPATQSH